MVTLPLLELIKTGNTGKKAGAISKLLVGQLYQIYIMLTAVQIAVMMIPCTTIGNFKKLAFIMSPHFQFAFFVILVINQINLKLNLSRAAKTLPFSTELYTKINL
ncbi:hypothetical protein HMPREF0541_02206 [Lacticaseibacillus rhamnosus ATCC 21052]|nr:hypothetical protein HMPREF0541_02206 [Lacticaseibacillus rhamnosus ATCC 21052]